jgi:hypothetical protein
MPAALQRERIPGDRTAASCQKQRGEDLARMADKEGRCPLADARATRRPGGALLRRSRRSPPAHDGGQVEIVIGVIGKNFTQESRFRLRRMMSCRSARREASFPVLLMAKSDRGALNET